MCDELKQLGHTKLPKPVQKIFKDLSTQSSSVSLFQKVNTNVLNQFLKDLSDPHKNTFSNTFIKMYPNIYERLKDVQLMNNQRSDIPKSIRILYQKLTEFVVAFYNGVEERDEDVYTERDGEVLTEFFPHFPAVFEKAEYEIDNKGNTKEKSSQKDLCAKLFPEHQKLTSGLFIVTCCCSNKKIYGFKKMVGGASPRIIFDIVMTRFEPWYNPDIIYDHSCKVRSTHQNMHTVEIFALFSYVS